MKRYIVAFLLFINASFLLAEENYQTLIELSRAEEINNIVKKENYLYEQAVNAFYLTGDTSLTIKKIQEATDLPYSSFTNYRNETCVNDGTYCTTGLGGITIDVNFSEKRIYLGNVMGANSSSLSDFEKSEYANNSNRNARRVVYGVIGSYILFDDTMRSFSNIVSNANATAGIELGTTFTDTAKTYYRPNGDGTVNVFTYNSTLSQWDDLGMIGGDGNSCLGYFATKEELDTITAVDKTCAEVATSGGNIQTYYWVGEPVNEWQIKETGSSGDGGLFNGDGTIKAMSTSLIKKSGGSIVTSSAPNSEFGGAKDFTKKDNSENNGYWVDSTNMFIVSDTLQGLKTQSWAENSYGWYFDKKLYTLRKMNVPSVGLKWAFVADGFDDVVLNFDEIDNSDGGYVYDTRNSKFFTKSSNVWTSIDDTTKLTSSSNGRDAFLNINSSYTYYILNNDCTSSSCNGLSTDGYYSGTKFDEMYVFYRSLSGKRKNNLIDAIPRLSISEMYDNDDTCALYSGNIFCKTTDTRSRPIYQRIDNGLFYSRAGVSIPTTIAPSFGSANLPPDYPASTISISSDYINISNASEATNWTDAPLGAKVRFGGLTYSHYTNGIADVNSRIDYWFDGSNFSNSTSVFTYLGRKAFPLASNASTNYFTKLLCSHDASCAKANSYEPRYTDGGVDSTDTTNFPSMTQWFYSTSGTTRTNNLLDAILVADNPYTNTTALSVGIAMKNGKLIIKSGSYWMDGSSYVDKDIIVRVTNHISPIGYYNAGYPTVYSTKAWGASDFDDNADGAFIETTLMKDVSGDVSTISRKGYSKYCYDYDTSYNLFGAWRLSGSSWNSAHGTITMSSSWQINCRKGSYTRAFWQDNSGTKSCPAGWSYVSYSNSSGTRTPYVLNGDGSRRIKTASCATAGSTVWYH